MKEGDHTLMIQNNNNKPPKSSPGRGRRHQDRKILPWESIVTIRRLRKEGLSIAQIQERFSCVTWHHIAAICEGSTRCAPDSDTRHKPTLESVDMTVGGYTLTEDGRVFR